MLPLEPLKPLAPLAPLEPLKPFDKVNILDVGVARLDLPGLLAQVQEWSRDQERRTIFYVNAHCFNIARQDAAYRNILAAADLVYADGISVAWAARFLSGAHLTKMTGADWIHDFCQQAQQVGLRLYILAGEPGIARLASDNLQNKYPGLKIVGCSDGWFSERSQSDVIHEINAASPHVVFIGLGVPRQEKWIAGRRKQIEAPVCWGVGALFDYVAGVEARVPRLMNLLALEWFWRLIMDPRGKWRRYLLGNPLFIYQVLRQKYGL